MKVLCWDQTECKTFFVLEVCAAYYDPDVAGLVLTPVYSSFDDFCYPDMDVDLCNVLIGRLYSEGLCDLREFGEIQMYSDIVKEDKAYE